MLEVSKEDFYKAIGPQNVSPRIVNDKWPYTSEFVTPSGIIRGISKGYIPKGSALAEKKYFLPKD